MSLSALLVGFFGTTTALAQPKKPNILVIWGDDIGPFNVSAYNWGIIVYKTPNIDPIAAESAVQQFCHDSGEHHGT